MALDNDRKYRDDKIFQMLEKNYLTLQDEDVKKANEFLKNAIERDIISLMKEDELFNLLFQRITYGGSFYKGTRYGKPKEFDLLLVIQLPFPYDYLKIDTNHTSYGYIKIKVDPRALSTSNWLKYRTSLNVRDKLCTWITHDNYLDQNKFRSWVEGIITSAMSKLENCSSSDCLTHSHADLKKTGPAFTINFKNAQRNIIMDVDLVPALEFVNVPLGSGYKTMNGRKNSWMAIAKPLSAERPHSNILWRLCFYEQEKEFLKGELKPVIRMVKKFRDTMKWEIASYFLETLIYNELEKYEGMLDHFLRSSKTSLFVHALKKLEVAFMNHYLPYFWNPKLNFLADTSRSEIDNYSNRLKKIIRSIETHIEDKDSLILAEIILESHELDEFKREYTQDSLSKLRF